LLVVGVLNPPFFFCFWGGCVGGWGGGGGGEASPFSISAGDCLLHGFTAVVGLGSASTMLDRVRFK